MNKELTMYHPSGWNYFAGILMIITGVFQSIAGLTAILKSGVYLVTANQLLVLDYKQWGWVHLIFGIVLIISSFSLFAGNLWGRILAITLASISAILNFSFIEAYPLWSIAIIVMDILIIYGLAVYGGKEA